MDSEQIESLRLIQEEAKSEVRFVEGSNIQSVKLAAYKTPIFKERSFKKWINCGVDNLWPNYLVRIMNGCAMHKKIIDNKVKQICGEGIIVEDSEDKDQLSKLNDFLKKIKFNKRTLKKIAKDQQIFGYWFLGITWNSTRTAVADIYHIDSTTLRVERPDVETKMVNGFWYSEDWTQFRKQNFEPEFVPIFSQTDRIAERGIMIIRDYEPGNRFYALPSYEGARDAIELVAELSSYLLNSIKNGLSPSLNISFNNGEPSDEQRELIYQQINNLYKGSNNAGKFLLSFNKSKDNATRIDPINVSNQADVYSQLDDYARNQILYSHGITSPMLAGVQTSGQLGGAGGELTIASELFFNQIIAPAQQQITEVLQEILEINGFSLKVWIKDIEPIKYQFEDSTLMSILTIDEMRNKIGMSPLSNFDIQNLAVNITQPRVSGSTTTATPAAAPVANAEMAADPIATNEAIRNLTGRQQQQIIRVIRQFSKGIITREVAQVLLATGLGLSNEDIEKMLPETEEEPLSLSQQIEEIKSKL